MGEQRELGANAWLGVVRMQAGTCAQRRLEAPVNGSGE
jgi:hypothetical protein